MARESSSRGDRQASNQPPGRSGSSRAPRGAETNRAAASPTPKTGSASEKASTSASTSASGDRERQITTGREEGQPTGSPGAAPVRRAYGLVNLGDPVSLIQRMAEDLDRLFEQFGLGGGLGSRGALSPPSRGAGQGLSRAMPSIWSPQVEVFRRGDDVVVRADLPGLDRNDVQVDLDNDVLTISGERRQHNEEQREGFYRTERSYGQFYRAIPIPENVDRSKVKASFNDGVLEVTVPIPKEEQRKSTRINIQ